MENGQVGENFENIIFDVRKIKGSKEGNCCTVSYQGRSNVYIKFRQNSWWLIVNHKKKCWIGINDIFSFLSHICLPSPVRNYLSLKEKQPFLKEIRKKNSWFECQNREFCRPNLMFMRLTFPYCFLSISVFASLKRKEWKKFIF